MIGGIVGIQTARGATVRVCNRAGTHRGQGLLLDLGDEGVVVLTCHHVVAPLGKDELCVALRQGDGQFGESIPAQYDAERSRPGMDAVVLHVTRERVPVRPRPLLHALDPKTYDGSLLALGLTCLQPDNFSAQVHASTRLEVAVQTPGLWPDPPARYVLPSTFRLAHPSDARPGISGAVVYSQGGVLGLAHFARADAPEHAREVYLVPLAAWVEGWPALGQLIQPLTSRAPLRALFTPLLADRRQLFGGREAVLKRLAEFVKDPLGKYLVVTAPAGFGKTALMANLVVSKPEDCAYHFFAPLYGSSTLSKGFFPYAMWSSN